MMGRHGSDRTFVEHVLLKCSNVLMARVGFEPSVWSYRTSASTAAALFRNDSVTARRLIGMGESDRECVCLQNRVTSGKLAS